MRRLISSRNSLAAVAGFGSRLAQYSAMNFDASSSFATLDQASFSAGVRKYAASRDEVLYRRGEYERARFYIRRVNTREDLSNAQTLWLALRIEHRIGNRGGVDEYARQLRSRFPQSPEALAYDRGRIDD